MSPQPDPAQVEAAIKLLQRNGYEVFRRSAGFKLGAVHTVDNILHSRHGGDSGGYMESVRGDLSRTLALHLQAEGLVAFEYGPVIDQDRVMPIPRTAYRAMLEVFPAIRKEWRR